MDDGVIQCSECGWPGAQTPPDAIEDIEECPLCGADLEVV